MTRDQILQSLIRVELTSSDNFLKVKETLTRMGVPNRDGNSLFQSCHILHKQGFYYIVHFKELFGLDGKFATMSDEDYARRDTIARMLQDWKLLSVRSHLSQTDPSLVTIIQFKDKKNWNLEPKYAVGGDKVRKQTQ